MKWPRKFGVLHVQRMNRWVRYPGRQAHRQIGIYAYSNPPAPCGWRTRRGGHKR